MRPQIAIPLALGLLAGLPLPQATATCPPILLIPLPKCSNKSVLEYSTTDIAPCQYGFAICKAGNQTDATVNCYSDVEGGIHDPYAFNDFSYGQELSDLTDSQFHCGECGNSCYDQGNLDCTAGTCTCVPGVALCLNGAGYCDSSSSTCKSCPTATMLNCVPGDDTGDESDCNIDITTDPSNCGQCDNYCLDGETCVGGNCVCGSSANGTRCLDPSAPFCIDGKCVACDKNQLTSDDACRTDTLDREYCAADGSCKSCPTGKADCTPDSDVGSEDDCETDVAVTGATDNCGSCGSPAGQSGTALTCCTGVPKCGTFANLSAPTTGECAAATRCSEEEYCDSNFKTCIPLSDPQYRNCRGVSTSTSDIHDNMVSSKYCFSCNKNETLENLAVAPNVNPNTVFACLSAAVTCGKLQNSSCIREDDAADCYVGKCVRTETSVLSALSWAEFNDVNPDPNVFMGATSDPIYVGIKPASGCSVDQTSGIATGLANYYSARYIRSFFTCISLYDDPYGWANYSLVTYETFANKSSRDTICNGKEGMCTTEFCDELFTNSTMYSSSFCSAVETSLGEVKRCLRDFRQKPGEHYFTDPQHGPFMTTTTIRSEDYDWAFGLRQKCLDSAYGDDPDALLMNTAIFLKCPIIPASITEGARFKIYNGVEAAFSNSLGYTEAGPRACVVTYSGARATSAITMTAVMTVMVVTVANMMGN